MKINDNMGFGDVFGYYVTGAAGGLMLFFTILISLVFSLIVFIDAKKSDSVGKKIFMSVVGSATIMGVVMLFAVVTSFDFVRDASVAKQLNEGYGLSKDLELELRNIGVLYENSGEVEELTSSKDIVTEGDSVVKSEKTLYGLLDEDAGTVTLFVSSSEEQELTELELVNG